MNEPQMLATVASVIAGFGVVVLVFRFQRELQMKKEGEVTWIPWADWLLIAAIEISLLFVLLPIIAYGSLPGLTKNLPAAASSAAIILLVGYIPAILAHYRLILDKGRPRKRKNPEPNERLFCYITAIMSLTVFGIVLSGIW